MQLHTLQKIHSAILISLGLWGYLSSASPSVTALIPVIVGTIILSVNLLVEKENKFRFYLSGVLTFILLVGLIMPLKGAIGRADYLALIRVIIMQLTTLIALFAYVKELKSKSTTTS